MTADPDQQERWWVGYIWAGGATVAAWVAQVIIGFDLPGWAQAALLVFGASSAALAFLLPVRQVAAARGRAQIAKDRESLARTLATDAVKDYRVKVHDVMIPIAREVGNITILPRGQQRRTAQDKLVQSIVDLSAENIGRTDRTRACFFDYSAGPPRQFTCSTFKGRADGPRGGFIEPSDRWNSIVRLIKERGARYVPDVSSEYVEGYDPTNAPYKTFISTPVMAGDRIIGMLAVDSPEPGDLTDLDVQEVRLFAYALGCGLADRAQTAPES